MTALHRWGVLPSNRLLLLTCLVEASTPTANNVVTMAIAFKLAAAEISASLFWQCLAFLPAQLFFLPVSVHLSDVLVA